MSPVPTGSRTAIMTMGIVSVAFLAAVTPCVPNDTMRSTLSRTSSAAKVGQPVDPTLRISIVDDNILALNPPELAQPLPERVEQGRPIGRGRQPKKTYPRHLSRLLLCARRERRYDSRSNYSCDETAPSHSNIVTTRELLSEVVGYR